MKRNQQQRAARTVRKSAGERRKGNNGRRGALLPALAVAAFCALAIFPVALTLSNRQPAAPAPTGEAATRESSVAAGDATSLASIWAVPDPVITFAPQATPEPTATPTPQPTPEPTPVPQPTPLGTLPVIHRADTGAKRIAVTVDDCYQLDNLQSIVALAEANGAKLTLFPVGENLSKAGMGELLRRCVFELGYEIENHTWSHSRIFRLPDGEMAEEIWKQDAALNEALGVDYREHFLRLMGGDGDTDPRIHSYLAQLGYLGIANWSVSGSDSDLAHIQSALAPGQVYLFHTTDRDTAKLEQFIPWAISQGYELVTLNALFQLPENEVSPLFDVPMPEPLAGVDDRHTITEGEYTWDALRIQDSLRALGYLEMDGPSTGYYGPRTVEAVARFQQDHGLDPTGNADEQTQRELGI